MNTKSDKQKILEIFTSQSASLGALSQISDPAERAKATALAEEVFVTIVDVLSAARKIIQENPEKLAEAQASRIPKS